MKESCESFEIIESPSWGIPVLEMSNTEGATLNLIPADLNSHENPKK